jgi:CBS domain-containing protein
MKVSDILKVKGKALFTCRPEEALRGAVQTMAENDLGSVVVMDRGTLAGMLTFREVIEALHRGGGSLGERRVDEVMRPVNLTISPDTDVMELRRVMIDTHVRYVPVVREGVLEGVLSLYDVAKAVLEEQSFENRMLKAYIRDWPEPEPVRG